MSLYEDARWEEIFNLPKTSIPMQPIIYGNQLAHARINGFGDRRLMAREWESFVRGLDWWPEQHRRAKVLVEEYYLEYRQLEAAIRNRNFPVRQIDMDSNKEYAVLKTVGSVAYLKDQINRAANIEQVKEAREHYGKSDARMTDFIFDPLLGEYRKWVEDLKRKELDAAAAKKRLGFKQKAAAELRNAALRAPPITNAKGELIKNMISVAMNLRDGSFELGRAGHGLTAAVLEPVFGFKLPAIAANAHVTQNQDNCGELEALYHLKSRHAGIAMTDVFFASMVPGGGSTIPPCANCQRWIGSIGAKAAGMNGD